MAPPNPSTKKPLPRGSATSYTAEGPSTAFAADLSARLVVVAVKDGGPHYLTIETPKGSALKVGTVYETTRGLNCQEVDAKP
jgi:hypothetical protein